MNIHDPREVPMVLPEPHSHLAIVEKQVAQYWFSPES